MIQIIHSSYPNIVEIPADIFDVYGSVERDPASAQKASFGLWILKCHPHKTRISSAHLQFEKFPQVLSILDREILSEIPTQWVLM